MNEEKTPLDRREFILAGGLVGAGIAVAAAVVVKDRSPSPPVDPTGEATTRQLDVLKQVKQTEHEDEHLRMQRELVRAMAKPVEQRRWIMVIDLRKCIGCHSCTIGCVAENKLPPGIVYRPVVTKEVGVYPNVRVQFLPRPCMHCENPSCVPVCPVRATWKRPDGIVAIDYDKCIGCRSCLNACPYGSRTIDFGRYYAEGAAVGAPSGDVRPLDGPRAPYEHVSSNEYAKNWKREGKGSPIGNARKCHLCAHRLEVGQLPMCVSTCIGRATYFGDSKDPKSLVVELTTKHNVQVLLEHWGNKPQCYYIV
ncbi:MAG: 4Fe-4S dicluster domain-containing protein [Thermodesulfobacteriota bacterium]